MKPINFNIILGLACSILGIVGAIVLTDYTAAILIVYIVGLWNISIGARDLDKKNDGGM
jgi:hypothetical protein